MRAALASVGLVLAAGPALASDVPRLDVGAICQAYVASRPQHLGTMEEQYDDCFVAHQEQYNELKMLWSKVDEATQTRCWNSSTAESSSNRYWDARACLEKVMTEKERAKAIAEEAAKVRARSKREFRY